MVVFGQAVTDAVLQSVNRFTGGQGRLAVYTDGMLSAATSPSESSPSPAAVPVAAGRAFTEGDFTSELVPLRDRQSKVAADLKVSVPRDTFATALSEINAITVGAFVISLLIAAAIGLVVAQTISRPLRRLAAAATAIADGHLRQELPTERHDEIGSLAQAFNTMSAQVAARIDGLSEKTQSLALEISNLSAFGATLAQTPDPHAELRRLADMIRAMLDARHGQRVPRVRGPHDEGGVQRRPAVPRAVAGRPTSSPPWPWPPAAASRSATPRPTST